MPKATPTSRRRPQKNARGERPRLFIGSSGEGRAIAQAIQAGLGTQVEGTIWHQGVFGLSRTNIESLTEATQDFDFAVLVLTPDDLLTKRGRLGAAPRDNVLFEAGLFMGALGRHRTFFVCCADDDLELPSDLDGLVAGRFHQRADGNLVAALGPVCLELLTAMERAKTIDDRVRPSREFVLQAEKLVQLTERVVSHQAILSATNEERAALHEELDALTQQLSDLEDAASGVLCPHCRAPIVERGGASESVEYGGREIDIDHEWEVFGCGRRVMDGRVEQECRPKVPPDSAPIDPDVY